MSRNAALRREVETDRDHLDVQEYGPRADGFARDLTDLCLKHGIGITGNPGLFVMEPEDSQLRYSVDDEGNLVLT